MNEAIMVPTLLIISLSLATATQLHDIAQQTADKTVAWADDANSALDCAYTARPLDECSPELFSYEFRQDADRTRAILDDLRESQAGPTNGPKDKPEQPRRNPRT